MTRIPRFREFNVLATALVGLGIIGLALVVAFTYPTLPFVRGTTYKALFTEAGGLKTGDEVRVAGTAVGKVIDMDLVGNRVQVSFTAGRSRLGTSTTAAIKTGTLLGKRYLGITPGPGPVMSGGDTIPVEHTLAPYSITSSIENVTQQIHDFDKTKLEAALNSFSGAFQDTPENFKATFANVKALSQTLNTRDQALRELLAHANAVSAVFAARTGDFQRLLRDGNLLLDELQRRKGLIEESLRGFQHVIHQTTELVKENDEQLYPTLDELNRLLAILNQHDHDLSVAIQRVSGFIGGLSEGIADGPQFAASVALNAPGDIFNYTDLLRQVTNPQAPRVPAMPGLPGLDPLPNPLNAPPSGAGSDPNYSNPNANGTTPSLPLLGGK
ncbi:virulence factor Mce family protein [Pseudonocardia eucalypti]|uniref:Virulence factor Mce family protein n=1 Tax=Pseudonocardia eucalypti TaxID=648755 RepID=A0ABP9QJE8_9PSEU|nr:phospholipid/cholesterol/gamma-HCH transport system substrate-binding protein [Pseudonocardia eucalypti]